MKPKQKLLEKLLIYSNFEIGLHVIRFFRNRKWISVVIDDLIPCGKDGYPVFATNRTPNVVWVPLIEKAYAKLCGSYEAIDSGQVSDGLVDLTGGYPID